MTVVIAALAVAVVLLAWRIWRLQVVLLNVHDTVTAEPAPPPEPVSVTDDTAVLDVAALRQVTLGELFQRQETP